jgi:hypothetical protein
LTVTDLRIFLPFTINLDPYLRKVLKEDQQQIEDEGIVIPMKQPNAPINHFNRHQNFFQQQPAFPRAMPMYPPNVNNAPIAMMNYFNAAPSIQPMEQEVRQQLQFQPQQPQQQQQPIPIDLVSSEEN